MSSTRSAALPPRLRGLRACLRCRLLKSAQQFHEDGCENCNDELPEEANSVESYTTPVFKGIMAMMQPNDSWIARWHGQQRRARGMYAMKVYGENEANNAAEEQQE